MDLSGRVPAADVPGQTILRGADGLRWVVDTRPGIGGFLTTARKTGCDLRPGATATSETLAEAARRHADYCRAIETLGHPTPGAAEAESR